MNDTVSAACYIRVSTEDQTEYSPDAQKKALEEYASQHGMRILPDHVYIDAGVSARKASTRPAFMAMIAAAKRHPSPFSVILVHKFDRFARNREDSIVYKSMLRRQCGVRVLSITERLEDDRMGLILEAMLEAMAEYYSINLGEEVRKGMVEKARRGELQTSPPFGYRAADNLLTPVPEEAEIVQQLFQRCLDGTSIAALSRWTKDQGVLSHRGNPIDSRGIRYILQNPVYIGKLRWGSGEEKTVADGAHKPLVDTNTFYAVQSMLAQNTVRHEKHAQPSGARRHWLSGLVKCSVCGGGMIFSRPYALRCGKYVKGRCERSQFVSAENLETAILEQIMRDYSEAGDIRLVFFSNNYEQRIEETQRQISALKKKIVRLREAYLCGAETAQEYQTEKEHMTEKIDGLQSMLDEVAFAPPNPSSVLCGKGILPSSDLSMEAKYRAASAVLADCTWDKDEGKLILTYRWQRE